MGSPLTKVKDAHLTLNKFLLAVIDFTEVIHVRQLTVDALYQLKRIALLLIQL